MFDVSVIVPMYNAEKYIVSCVDALLSQSLENIEIIIVNDCSTDNSMDICRKHFGNNDRVQLIEQPRNMGPGAARNAGIVKARGEYIAFADSDDGVRPDAYLCMYRAAKETDADILHVTGALMQTVDEAPDDINILTEDELYHVTLDEGDQPEGITVLPDDLGKRLEMWMNHQIHWSIWNKLFRRSFIEENHLLFGDTKMAEDQIFCLACLLRAPKYVKLPGEWYLYRIGGVSLTRGQKQMKALLNALETQIRIPVLLESAMDGVPYMEDNDSMKKKIKSYVLDLIEEAYILPSCDKLGIEELQNSADLMNLFDRLCGQSADYTRFLFLDAHKDVHDIKDLNELLNTPSFWKGLKENGGKFQ